MKSVIFAFGLVLLSLLAYVVVSKSGGQPLTFFPLAPGASPSANVATSTPAPNQPTPTPGLDYSLPFTSETVVLNRMGSGNIRDTFWGKPVNSANVVDGSGLPNDGALYHSTHNDVIYEPTPGGYNQFSLITGSDLSGRVGSLIRPNHQETCQLSTRPLGITVKVILCTITNINPQNPSQKDISTVTNVYLPLTNDQYLAYEVGIKAMGDVDLFSALTNMGVQAVSLR
jgi:hypothetical protein